MKYLFLFLISFNLLANEAYILKSEFVSKKITQSFRSKKDCEKKGQCFKVDEKFRFETVKTIKEEVDDFKSPVYSKSEIQKCLPILDDPLTLDINESKTAKQVCKEIIKTKTCLVKMEFPVIAKDFSEIYCSKFLRYNKKLSGRDILVEDTVKKVKYESDKKLKDSYDKLVTQELNDMKFGQKLYAMVKVLNKQKGLSKTQRDSLKTSLKNIKDAMFDGDLCDARSKTALIVPDGVLISQSDIDLILSKMDSYKKCI